MIDIPNWIGFADGKSAYTYSIDNMKAMIARWKKGGWDKKGLQTVVRIPFMFSTYTFTKLDALIALVAAEGWGCYLDEHPWKTDSAEPNIGSAVWLAAWDVVASHYANNPSLLGYELINETYSTKKDPSVNTDATMQKMLYTLAHKVWNRDQSKYIFLCQVGMVGQYSNDYTDMNGMAILTLHPYSYPTQSVWSPLKTIADNRFTEAKFVASLPKFTGKFYISEIEGHPPSGGGSSPELESMYLTEIIDVSLQKGGGVCLWHYEQALDDGGVNADDALSKVAFPPITPPPTPPPTDPCKAYKDQIIELNGQITALKIQIENLNSDNTTLQNEIVALNTENMTLDTQVGALQDKANALQVKINNALKDLQASTPTPFNP